MSSSSSSTVDTWLSCTRFSISRRWRGTASGVAASRLSGSLSSITAAVMRQWRWREGWWERHLVLHPHRCGVFVLVVVVCFSRGDCGESWVESVYSCVRITEISKERSAGNNKESELTCVCVCVCGYMFWWACETKKRSLSASNYFVFFLFVLNTTQIKLVYSRMSGL